jgi:DNA polymerase III subunit alpha
LDYLWLDAETTGLDANKHDIVQFACIPVVNGQKQKPFNEHCQPLNWKDIDPGATAVHGITENMMRGFQSQVDMVRNLVKYLKQFNTKFAIAGFNVGFDKGFLSAMFIKHGYSKEFFELFSLDVHDTYDRAKLVKGQLATTNLKLETLANHYGFSINAHDALSDIEATIYVDKKIGALLGESDVKDDVTDYSSICIDRKFKQPAQLHLHSVYGMMDSMPTLEQWDKWCTDNDVPAFSVCDHGTAISLHDASNISKAIPGAGLFVVDEKDDKKYYSLNAWAVSNTGYSNLMKLSSMSYDKTIQDMGRTISLNTVQDIKKYSEGLLFGTSGVDSCVGKALINDSDEALAEEKFLYMKEVFGDSLYWEFIPVDITRTFTPKAGFQKVNSGNIQKQYNRFIAKMIHKHGDVNCIPTSNAHFIDKDDKLVQDCVSKNSYSDKRYYHQSYHAITGDDMYRMLKTHLGDWLTEDKYEQWIENTLKIAETAKDVKITQSFHLPKIDIPDEIVQKTDDYDKQVYLFMMLKIKEHGRWKDDPIYIERFKKELDVIMKNDTLNFIPYFLVYEDISTYARSQGILQNIARGSAGGSLLSYYLKIIHVDPIRADLPFERFLSHARIRAGSFPDIDMDIGDSARPAVMRYLKEKYGFGFAQICTFSKMKTKNAIKHVMYALYGKNRNDIEVKAVCDTIPDSPQGVDERDFLHGYEDKEGVYHSGQLDTNEHLRNFFEKHPPVAHMVDKMIGLINGWSRHASAFVISTMDLGSDRCPTLTMMDSNIGPIQVTQYDASMVEKVGLVKADILGLKTLSAVSECVHRVKERLGINYLEEDENGMSLIYRLPEDDGVYADFYNKDTDSSFQFSTELIKGYIQEFVPTQRKHLADMTALCRPGALDAEWEPGISAAQYYMDVRNGKKKMEFIHDDLKPILSSSNGAFVYQEEIMTFLVDIGGYTLEDSDQIRNAIAKKKHEKMMEAFGRIRESTKKRGWSEEQTEKICNHVMAFSRYSFNKSHSYAYAELGYITMYLKHHHPLEWWSSVLSCENSESKMRKYVSHLGNTIAPPSMKYPSDRFEILNDKIVAPIGVVKGVGKNTVNELMDKGPFEDLEDFCDRVNHTKVNIGHIGSMIKARAADSFMRNDLPYAEARQEFMQEYRKIRKTPSKFKDELLTSDPIDMFLMERDSNECFNRHLLSDNDILDIITSTWPGLKPTGRKGIPFTFGNHHVINDLKVAEGLVKKNWDQDVGMIMLYEGSRIKSGVSKKSGKPYQMLTVTMSDGYSSMEGVLWDASKPLKWPINTIIYVRGKLREGWKDPVSITISEIEKVEKQ